jgi:hypothetical protein
MHDAVSSTCTEHSERFHCPDALVHYSPQFDEYGFIVHDGGSSAVAIAFCPWCGATLPESKRSAWFDELARRGFADPVSQEIPLQFRSDAWWRG